MTERVNLFLPASDGTLPHPGTPVPEFEATSTDGRPVSAADFEGAERIFAALSTGCSSCLDQIASFRDLGATLKPQPIITVIGSPEERAPMVASLAGHAVVLEESAGGPIVEAFEIGEFPAVFLIRERVIQVAEHGLASVLAASAAPAAESASASLQRQH